MMSFEPRLAAPWIEVSPIVLTASTSLPTSQARRTASSKASRPSSQVWFTTRFTPAAARDEAPLRWILVRARVRVRPAREEIADQFQRGSPIDAVVARRTTHVQLRTLTATHSGV
jgi:hypothetical protein